MRKERIVWIDQLRAIAFFFVILGHMINDRWKTDIWIYSFHMPLFLIISGFNLNFDKMAKTELLPFLKRNTERLLVPYFWLMSSMIIFRYILDYETATPKYAFKFMVGAALGHNRILDFASIPMYFILILFLSQLCLWVLARLVGNDIGKMFIIVVPLTVISIATQLKVTVWHINVIPVAVAFMLVGKLIMSFIEENESKIYRLKLPACLIISGVLFVLGFFLQRYNTRVSLNLNYYGRDFMLYFVAAILTSLAFIFISTKLPNIKLLSYIGQNTIFFLGIHEPMMYPIERTHPELLRNPLSIIVIAIAYFLLPVPVVYLFNKYMPYFNGNSLKRLTPATRIAKVFAVMFAALPVYVTLLRFAFDGAFTKNKALLALSFVIYVGLSVAVERLFSLKMPFMFCQQADSEKPKAKALKASALQRKPEKIAATEE